jgi:hypothetical protein
MALTSRSELPTIAADTWPEGADILVQYDGRWMSYAAFEAARLDKLMPRQPKRDWRRA